MPVETHQWPDIFNLLSRPEFISVQFYPPSVALVDGEIGCDLERRYLVPDEPLTK